MRLAVSFLFVVIDILGKLLHFCYVKSIDLVGVHCQSCTSEICQCISCGVVKDVREGIVKSESGIILGSTVQRSSYWSVFFVVVVVCLFLCVRVCCFKKKKKERKKRLQELTGDVLTLTM